MTARKVTGKAPGKAQSEAPSRGALASAVIEVKPNVPQEQRQTDAFYLAEKQEWAPYFKYEAEREPDRWAKLIEVSVTHGACVRSKVRYCLGDGFTIKAGTDDSIFSLPSEKVEVPKEKVQQVMGLARNVNVKRENLRDIARRAFYNMIGLGGVFVELVKVDTLGKRGFYIYCHDVTDCAVSWAKEDGSIEYAFIHNNWAAVYENPRKYEPRKVAMYPNWEKDEKGAERTMLYHCEPSFGRKHYGVPAAIASLLHQKLEHRIPKFNIEEFDNGFMPSAIVQLMVAQGTTEKKAQAMVRKLRQTFTGEGKGRNMFVQAVEGEAMKAVIDILDAKREGHFTELGDMVEAAILKAHSWHEALAGIARAGSLGNSQEIRNALLLAQANEIRPMQQDIMTKIINPAFREYMDWIGKGLDNIYLDIANSIPLPFFGDMTVDDYVLYNEGRDVFGYSELDNEGLAQLDEKRKKAPVNNASNNGNPDNSKGSNK